MMNKKLPTITINGAVFHVDRKAQELIEVMNPGNRISIETMSQDKEIDHLNLPMKNREQVKRQGIKRNPGPGKKRNRNIGLN